MKRAGGFGHYLGMIGEQPPQCEALEAGRVLGERYEIVTHIGTGGMGMVHRAIDRLRGETVALKIVPGATAEALRRESLLARALSHRSVVQVLDIGVLEETAFLAMEYVNGPTLAELLAKRGRLSVEEFLPIFRQLCEALVHLHSRQVVHCDIKPANLMLGEDGVLKLMDFGVAVRVGEKPALTLRGTPGYIAPELFAGAQPGPSTDIFAAGAVFYELLTGVRPDQGSPPGDGEKGLRAPEELAKFIERCIALDPDRRFGNWEEFMQEANTVMAAVEPAQRVGTLAELLTQEAPDLGGALAAFAAVAQHLAKAPTPVSLAPRAIRVVGNGAVEIGEAAAEPKYSAPEIFQEGGGGDDAQAKTGAVYVLGFIFYELALGSRKFQSQFAEVLARQDEVAWLEWHGNPELEARPLKDLRPDCPPALSQLVAAMMAKQAGKRPGMAEVSERLRGISTRVGSTIAAARPKKPRKPFPVAAVAVIVGIAALAACGYAALRRWPEMAGHLVAVFTTRSVAPAPALPEPSPPPPPAPEPPKPPEPPPLIDTKAGPMVLIPKGVLTMGNDHGRKSEQFGYENEAPAHPVQAPAFYIDKFEVTNAHYRMYCQAEGRMCPANPPWDAEYSEKPEHPVLNVSWDDARKFCEWAGKQLPTETQWERAARGPGGTIYPWGNHWQLQAANVKSEERRFPHSAPVGSFASDSSAWGVMDLAGNVPEWTADDYRLYTGNPAPLPAQEIGQKTIRGGGFYLSENLARATNRASHPPAIPSDGRFQVGFRCVVNLETTLKRILK